MHASVCVVGDAFVDVYCPLMAPGTILPSWGGDVLLNSVGLKAGGSAANVASHLASLSKTLKECHVDLYTALGEDKWAQVIEEHHAKAGSRLCAKRMNEKSTGVCVVLSGAHDRAFLTSHGAMDSFSPNHLSLQAMSKSRHVHFGGYFSLPLFQEMVGQEPGICQVIRGLRELEPAMTISLDTNYDASNMWGKGSLVKVLNLVDIFKANRSEALEIATRICDQELDTSEQALDVLCSSLREGGTAIITLGAEGVMYKTNSATSTLHRQPSYQVSFVDATGAGDAFMAAFLFKLVLCKEPVSVAADFGVRGGCCAVEHAGACDTLLEVSMLEMDRQKKKMIL